MTLFVNIAVLVLITGSVFFSDASTTIERHLFAISANNGGEGRPVLRYAESDAKSFAKVLTEMGGIAPGNKILLREPSVKEIQNEFATLGKKLSVNKINGTRKEILVYYSGHADEQGLRLGSEHFSWKALRAQVDALPADVKIAVIDACGSGAITRLKGGMSVPAFMMDASSDMKGYAFITSSTQDESSQESDKLKGSFFTYSLVSGLRGAGDLSGDGKVTLSEAYQFAFNETLQKTQQTSGGAQHPSRDMNLAGTGDVVMTDVRSMSAGLALDSSLEGRFFIRDASGSLVAELYKRQGRAIELGLPSGKYTVQLEQPRQNKVASITLYDGKRQTLSERNFILTSTEKTRSRGGIDNDHFVLDSLKKSGKGRFSFNIFDSDNQPRKGVQMGIFATRSEQDMSGGQLSLLANLAQKDFSGIQMSAIMNYAGYIEGVQLNDLVNLAGSFDGAQVGTWNVASGKSSGAQVGIVNAVTDTLNGGQVGIVNISKVTDKVQLGIINATHASKVQIGIVNAVKTSEVQVGVVNVATDTVNGVQVATFNFAKNITSPQVSVMNVAQKSNMQGGVLNITKTEKNIQLGVTNIADSVGYAQVGVLNIADNVGVIQGSVMNIADSANIQAGVLDIGDSIELQIGVINIAHHVGDRQVGVLNICGYCENTPVGLISIRGNGVLSVSEFVSETGHFATNLRLGSTYFFSSFEYSRVFEEDKQFQKWDDVQVSGIGFGTQFGVYGTHFDLEYMLANVYDRKKQTFEIGFDSNSDANYYHRLRLGSTIKIFPGLGLLGGVSANVVTEGYGDGFAIAPKGDWFAHWNFDGHEVRVWPGFYAGLVVGKF